MRGTVLLLGGGNSRDANAEYFRAHELLVYDTAHPDAALERLDSVTPDVVVVFFDVGVGDPSVVRALRSRMDEATSLIIVSDGDTRQEREQHRAAGADSFLSHPTHPDEILYEIRRALILRRSGRRLPWNWREEPQAQTKWWSRVLGAGS